jgi:hypothetical protein
MTEYQRLVEDFADRTRTNLHALRELQEEHPNVAVYEVTQFINSLLGLLILPQQRYFNSIPETPLGELEAQGWPMPKMVGDFNQAKDLRQLFRYLRNAVAHFNIEFIDDGQGHLTGLVVWNIDPRSRQITWKARLTLQQIEDLVDRFTDLILAEQTS